MKKSFITALALVASTSYAQLNLLSDSNFGSNSIVNLNPGLSGFLSYHFINGKIIVQNFDLSTSSLTDSRITLLGTDGSIDSSFGTGGSFACPLMYGTAGSDDFIHNSGAADMMMFSGKKFHYDGTLDSTYGTAGQTEIQANEVYRKVLPNGNLLIRTTDRIYQLNPSGQLDSTFGISGTIACNSILSNYTNTAFSNNEKFVAFHSGNSVIEYESNNSTLRKMNYTTGNYDTSFGINGNAQYTVGASATIMKFCMMNDNSLINYLFEESNPSAKFLTKTLPSGMLDTSFGSNGRIDLPGNMNGTDLLYAQDFTMVNNHVVIPVMDNSYPRKLFLLSADGSNLSTINGQNLLDTGITTSMINPDDKISISAKDNYLYLMISPRIIKRYVISNNVLAVNETDRTIDVWFVNPFRNELNLITNEEIKSVEIFDKSGRLIMKSRSSKNINTSGLQKGIYIIKITTQKDKIISKKGMKL
ncbi:T9SS type A sorting domain-containing protein [uncultured Chryseobacterium sp.]|uniref:T9SS type A sorting domain-containing protein n=1 Tax=uncultured Chryseobacterium sp. TaxID=259322 RepID=UPI0025DFCE86|nr:T9SS type A sorting domain-containing protein [uncultured Chryseobacterium sp.]